MIFTYLVYCSHSKFPGHSSFYLARSTCSFYWCCIFFFFFFFFLWSFLLKISNTEGKTHVILWLLLNRYIHRKVPVLEFLFIKCWRPSAWFLLKRDFNIGVFLWILQNFKKSLFLTLPVATYCRNGKMFKRANLEYSVNVQQKQPLETSIKNLFLDTCNAPVWSLFFIKIFQ